MKTIIIAGITRSGLTATMQMLDAGGYPCVGTFPAYEDVELRMEKGALQFEKGKATKMIDPQCLLINPGEYHVIRLKRNHEQQAKSMCKVLRHLGFPFEEAMERHLMESLNDDYEVIDAWATKQSGFMELEFETIINEPFKAACAIRDFVGCDLDTDRMALAIKKRSSDCYPTMLEAEML